MSPAIRPLRSLPPIAPLRAWLACVLRKGLHWLTWPARKLDEACDLCDRRRPW